MSYEVTEMLETAFAQYDEAAVRVASTTGRDGTADPVALRVLRQARIALCHVLELSGWEMPPEVRSQLLHDRTQLARSGTVAA